MGLNISLPFEQESNPYISDELNLEFHYFFMRKLWFVDGHRRRRLPRWTQHPRRTGRTAHPDPDRPQSAHSMVQNFGTISPEDLSLFHRCDSPEEAFDCLKEQMEPLLQDHGQTSTD